MKMYFYRLFKRFFRQEMFNDIEFALGHSYYLMIPDEYGCEPYELENLESRFKKRFYDGLFLLERNPYFESDKFFDN